MKAHQVTSEPTEVPQKPCTICGKKLLAPWGRVNYGAEWTCSRTCYETYMSNAAATHRSTVGSKT